MRITELRKEIKTLLPNIFSVYGFSEVGVLGESIKTDNSGNKFAVLIDEIKDSDSFSITVRVLVFYKAIEEHFEKVTFPNEYTINVYLAAKSIAFEEYSSAQVEYTKRLDFW